MTKKILALWLVFAMLLTAGFALADDEVQAVEVEEAGITFNVPAAWRVECGYLDDDDAFVVYGENEDETQFMVLKVYEVGSEPLESFIEALQTTEGLGGLKETKVGDLDFVLYDYAEPSNLGAFTITADGYLFTFEFGYVSDPQISAIAEQVLLSIAPL